MAAHSSTRTLHSSTSQAVPSLVVTSLPSSATTNADSVPGGASLATSSTEDALDLVMPTLLRQVSDLAREGVIDPVEKSTLKDLVSRKNEEAVRWMRALVDKTDTTSSSSTANAAVTAATDRATEHATADEIKQHVKRVIHDRHKLEQDCRKANLEEVGVLMSIYSADEIAIAQTRPLCMRIAVVLRDVDCQLELGFMFGSFYPLRETLKVVSYIPPPFDGKDNCHVNALQAILEKTAKDCTGSEGGSVFNVVEAAKLWVDQNAASLRAESQLVQGADDFEGKESKRFRTTDATKVVDIKQAPSAATSGYASLGNQVKVFTKDNAIGIAGAILSSVRPIADGAEEDDVKRAYIPGKYELPVSWRAFPPSVSGFTYGQGRVESLVESAIAKVQEVTHWSSAVAKAKLGRRKWNVEQVVNESFGDVVDDDPHVEDDMKREKDIAERADLLRYRLPPGSVGYKKGNGTVDAKDEEKPAEKRDKRGEAKGSSAIAQKEKEKLKNKAKTDDWGLARGGNAATTSWKDDWKGSSDVEKKKESKKSVAKKAAASAAAAAKKKEDSKIAAKKAKPAAGIISAPKKSSKSKSSGVGAKKLAEASKRDQFLALLTEDSIDPSSDRLQKLTDALLASPSYAVSSFTCTACFEEKDTGAGASMTCAHWMCFPCWEGFLTSKIQEGDPFVRCPGVGCTEYVAEEMIMALVETQDHYRRYRRWLQNSFIKLHGWQWCPHTPCTYVARVGEVGTVACGCKALWCFSCHKQGHWPVSCELRAAYLNSGVIKDMRKDFKLEMVKEETQQLKIHTKNCPQCETPWWKNGGCNHFTCSCKHEFCWICLGPWSSHKGGYFNCEMKIAKGAKEGMEITEVINAKVVQFESEHEIARIKGYCEREMAHYILSTRVKKIRHDDERMVRLADKLPGVDVAVLDKVMAFLWECHVVLRYCYVFLYIYAEHFIPDEETVGWQESLADVLLPVTPSKPRVLPYSPYARDLLKTLSAFEYWVDTLDVVIVPRILRLRNCMPIESLCKRVIEIQKHAAAFFISTNEFSKYLKANGFINPRIVNHFLEYEATLAARREELVKAGYRNKSEVARPGVIFMAS